MTAQGTWTETSPWTMELWADGVLLGRVCKNGFNVLAYGAGNEHLGYWTTVDAAKAAVVRWLEIKR